MIKKIILFCFFLVTPSSYGVEYNLITLDELRVDYISFTQGGRDPLISDIGLPNREIGKLLDLNVNTTILNYFYWRSLIHSYSDAYSNTHENGQFRVVGLNMELGLRLTHFLDVYGWHYSQHVLDTGPIRSGFPVQDGIGIHLYIYSKDRKESLLE